MSIMIIPILAILGSQTASPSNQFHDIVEQLAQRSGRFVIAEVRDDLPTAVQPLMEWIDDPDRARVEMRKLDWDFRIGKDSIAVFRTTYTPENFPTRPEAYMLGKKYGCITPDKTSAALVDGQLTLSKPLVVLASDLPVLAQKPKTQINWFAGRTPICASHGTVTFVELMRMAGAMTATRPVVSAEGDHSLVPDGSEFSRRYRRHLELKTSAGLNIDPAGTFRPERQMIVLYAWDMVKIERKDAWMGTASTRTTKPGVITVGAAESPRLEELVRLLYRKFEIVSSGKTAEAQTASRYLGLLEPSRPTFVWFRLMSGDEQVVMPSNQQPNSYTGI